MVKLRDYQRDGLNAIKSAWKKNISPMVAVATGGGKTTMIANLIKETRKPSQRAIVIVHTREIVHQIHKTVEAELGHPVGLIMARKNDINYNVIVASRQSLFSRIEELLEFGNFKIIIIDEAHHACTDNSYGTIVKKLTKKGTKLAGFTATPCEKNQTIFDKIVFSWSVSDGIKSGYLVPLIRIRVKMNILQAYKKFILDSKRQCLAFFPSVQQSKRFTKSLSRLGVRSAHIDGTTPKQERDRILTAYQKGKIQTICNMQVLTEGFDAPPTSAIFLARTTRSNILLSQILGRGLRPSPGKKDCLVLEVK